MLDVAGGTLPDDMSTPAVATTSSRWVRRSLAIWVLAIVVLYTLGVAAVASQVARRPGSATAAASGPAPVVNEPASTTPPTVPLQIAQNMLHGDVGLDGPPGGTDTVTRDGRSYDALSIGPILPSLAFAPFPVLWPGARWVIALAFGIAAALVCWPLAARYGPGGSATPWLATLGAAGTLLLPLSVMGNYYYLAHQEAMLFTIVALLELRGRGRPWAIGLALGLAVLARPTVALAIVPIGLYVVLGARQRLRSAIGMAIPVAAAAIVIGWYNLARFGSPLDTGYATSILHNPTLVRARNIGLFSVRHVAPNLRVLLAGGFGLQSSFPFVIPSSYGHSILLTTPALVLAVRAGFRDRLVIVLWLSAAVVTVPLLLYYGGAGYQTYGFRYFLDVTPFLLALVALGARQGFGPLAKALVVLSVVLCAYGVFWGAFNGHF